MTLELQNGKFSPPRRLFSLCGNSEKNRASNLHFAKIHKNPQPKPGAAAIPLKEIPQP
jgi:hypothetical protein